MVNATRGTPPPMRCLVLQLSFHAKFPQMSLPMARLGDGLVDAAPKRPAEEVLEGYAGGELQAADGMADLARAEIDRRSRRLPPLCLAWRR